MKTFKILGIISAVIIAACASAYASANDDLLDAIKKHDLKAVQSALAAGAKPAEAKDSTNTYAIDWAAFAGDNEIVKAVIAAGGDVNTPGYLKYTPLIQAAMWSNVDVVKTLLDAKADVSAKDTAGNTALMLAATKCANKEIIRMLAAAGANVNEKDKLGNTPLLNAVLSADRDQQLAGAKMMEAYGLKPKTAADLSTTAEVVQALVDAGADVNVRDSIGRTPLVLAGANKRPDVAKVLIGAKAEANTVGNDKVTPLMAACLQKDEATALALIASGADVKATSLIGASALHYAASKGLAAAAKAMVDAGADVNATDTLRTTPLMRAAMRGHASIVKMLLDAKADPEKKDIYKNTALQFARSMGYKDVEQIFNDRHIFEIGYAKFRTGTAFDAGGDRAKNLKEFESYYGSY